MFYLLIFLSLAVGVLFYMFNPMPVNFQQDMDVRRSEILVVSFLNQHQAAKEYVRHWLGKVHPAEMQDGNRYAGGTDVVSAADSLLVEQQNAGKNLTYSDVKVIALPSFMEKFKPSQIQPISWERLAGGSPKVGKLNSEEEKGYASALVCMNQAGDALVNCYKYLCQTGSSIAECTDPIGFAGTTKIEYNPNVKPYIFTYGVQSGLTDSQQDRAQIALANQENQEWWKSALFNRSHGSEKCGFLVAAPGDDLYWIYDITNAKKGKIPVALSMVSGPKYCIYNGNQCYTILPEVLENYLKRIASDDDLSDYLVCLSAVSDPYERIEQTTYHYDGIDACALGAGTEELGCNNWVPVTGTLSDGYTLVGSVQNGSGLLIENNNPVTVPINPGDADFTVSFIMDDEESYTRPEITINQVSVTLDTNTSDKQRIFTLKYDNDPSHEITLDLSCDSSCSLPDRYAWTVMRRDDKIYFFLNGWQIVVNDLRVNKKGCWDAGSTKGQLEFGGVGSGSGHLMDVRYYNRALSAQEIWKNFKLDAVRYKLSSLEEATTNGGNKAQFHELPTTGYPRCDYGDDIS